MEKTNEKIKQAILYLIKCLHQYYEKKPCRTEIMKLMYLSDLIASERKGQTITGAEYRYHYYGPYSKDVMEALLELERSGQLKDELQVDEEGDYERHSYSLTDLCQVNADLLNEDERRLIEAVARGYGDFKLGELLSLVYNIGPMVNAKMGDVLIARNR